MSLLFLALTTALLVLDLKRPDRFPYILLKPNWRSWLVWGAWILMAFGGAGGLWLLGGLGGDHGLIKLLAVPTILLALATAGYSAFLFGQAEGRDFWQSPLVLPHLIVAALVAGHRRPDRDGDAARASAGAADAGPDPRRRPGRARRPARAELFSRHPVHDVARAARLITRGALRGALLGRRGDRRRDRADRAARRRRLARLERGLDAGGRCSRSPGSGSGRTCGSRPANRCP